MLCQEAQQGEGASSVTHITYLTPRSSHLCVNCGTRIKSDISYVGPYQASAHPFLIPSYSARGRPQQGRVSSLLQCRED